MVIGWLALVAAIECKYIDCTKIYENQKMTILNK